MLDDVGNRLLYDAKDIANKLQRLSVASESFYKQHIICCKRRVRATFYRHIDKVLFLRSKEQMVWINTVPNVAFVQDG